MTLCPGSFEVVSIHVCENGNAGLRQQRESDIVQAKTHPRL